MKHITPSRIQAQDLKRARLKYERLGDPPVRYGGGREVFRGGRAKCMIRDDKFRDCVDSQVPSFKSRSKNNLRC